MGRDEALARLKSALWLADVRPFLSILDGEAYRTRVVGGIVRDTLLGMDAVSTDIDLATELVPHEVIERARDAGVSAHPTGITHGTVTLAANGITAEVTTLRQDVETFGRQARVMFGADWEADARRRDFTMNALYCDAWGGLFDPLEGLADCLERCVRFIGDADRRIAEDRLRVYRYFRFAVSHGGQNLETEALAACARAAPTLGALSPERVGGEMMRILNTPSCAKTLRAMGQAQILQPPTFADAVFDGLDRLETLDVRVTAITRLGLIAALGVPVKHFREAWRLSNAVVRAVETARVAAQVAAAENWVELAYRWPDENGDGLAIATVLSDRSGAWLKQGLGHVRGLGRPVFPLKGQDVLDAGLPPGPEVGKELSRLEAVWLQSGGRLDKPGLLKMVRPLG